MYYVDIYRLKVSDVYKNKYKKNICIRRLYIG